MIDFSNVKRVLVTKLRHHGDVLLTTPVFTVLKSHYPHLEVDALIYSETEAMLELHPAINHIFSIDRAWKKTGSLTRLSHEYKLLKQLRQRKYDVLIHLTENPRGAFLARLLRIPYSIAGAYPHKHGKLWRNSFSHTYRTPPARHMVEQNLDALRRTGIQPAEDERRLVLVPGHEAEQHIDTLMAQYQLTDKQFIHLHPTSRWLFKCWPESKCTELLQALSSKGETIVVTAAPDDKEMTMIKHILKNTHNTNTIDLSGQLSLKQLAALTARAKCFVGVDTAPMHMAAAMQTPVIALFGPSYDSVWGPWMVPGEVISMDYSCRPCGLDGCGSSKVSECLTTIPVEMVLNAISSLVNPTGISAD